MHKFLVKHGVRKPYLSMEPGREVVTARMVVGAPDQVEQRYFVWESTNPLGKMEVRDRADALKVAHLFRKRTKGNAFVLDEVTGERIERAVSRTQTEPVQRLTSQMVRIIVGVAAVCSFVVANVTAILQAMG